VIFMSDNGPHKEGHHSYKFFNSPGPLRGYKRSLYEGGIRVPLIVKWPGKVAPGSVSKTPVVSFDFLHTFSSLAGVEPPPSDGEDLTPVLTGQGTLKTRPLYWEYCTKHKWGHALRLGDYKIVNFGLHQKLRLYNLRKDVGEKHDLAARNPALVKRLEKIAKTMHVSDPQWPVHHCINS